jgi:hypothetical protein
MHDNDTAIQESEKSSLTQQQIEEVFVSLWETHGDNPPDPTVSNQTILWGVELLKNLVARQEVRWVKEHLDEMDKRKRQKITAAKRYAIKGPPPLEMQPGAYKALQRVGLSYDHKTGQYSGWHTPRMEEMATQVLARQAQLI